MKILFAGGGTMGSVTPLLAIVEAWRKRDSSVEFVWVGTPNGPERDVVEKMRIKFYSIPVARLTREFSFEWFLLPVNMLCAIVKSFLILRREHPVLIGSAGGYTAVPIILVGKIIGVKSWIHQQDARMLLTTRVLLPFVELFTTAFISTLSRHGLSAKSFVVGNPVRDSILLGDKARAAELFNLDLNLQTVLVVGGGTGAQWINDVFANIGSEITKKANVIHITGKGKMIQSLNTIERYHAVEFLDEEMKHAHAVADIVVSRAGMGMITELAGLSKPSILVPLPESAQIDNVESLGTAVVDVRQEQGVDRLKKAIETLLESKSEQSRLGKALHVQLKTDTADELIDLIEQLLSQ